ncbi:MAG: polymer-forming cytoskeletal protein [Anaerolineae bacterium]|nr:polymer-forming cytoskeletal protein [Anaerolineae bacterium]
MLKALRLTLFATVICLLTTGVVFARELRQGENCTIPADTVIKGSLFTFCQNLTIAGRVEGNLIGIGLRATISGEIGKNVYLAGLTLEQSGAIQGDLHYVGLMLHLDAPAAEPHRPVEGQLIFAALSAAFAENTQIAGPVTGVGYQVLIDGRVDDEFSYWGSAFVLSNLVQGDVYTTVGNPETDAADLETLLLPLDIEFSAAAPGLTIAPRGRISGRLEYFGPAEAIIEGRVDGQIEYHSTTPVLIPDLPQQGLGSRFYDQFKRELTVLLTAGLLGLALARKQFQHPLSHLRGRPVHSFVIGMLLFIISFPVVLILLIITTIAILLPLALHLDGVALVAGAFLGLFDIGVIGVFYFTAIFIARAVVGLGVGRLVLNVALGPDQARRRPRLSVLIGAALLALFASLPVVGFLFNAGALFMGLGSISGAAHEWLQRVRLGQLGSAESTGFTPPSAPSPQQSSRVPFPAAPIALPPIARGIGLDNLPEGFDPDLFFEED